VRRYPALSVALGLLIANAVACSATAATFPVDDTATLPGRAISVMRWRTPGPSASSGNIVDGSTVVTVVLDTEPWLHRYGRIYMVAPQPPLAPVTVDWTTQGRFLPGRLLPGQRALIYAGPVTTKRLSDTMTVGVHTDGRRLTSSQDLHFSFEIDVE
jgi:hypothetical protein